MPRLFIRGKCFVPQLSAAAPLLFACIIIQAEIQRQVQKILQLTQRLVEAGQIIGIEVLDHLLLVIRTFISLKEQGFM